MQGRPKIEAVLEVLIVRLAKENKSWGYDRIVVVLANLGHTESDQMVENIVKQHDPAPAPERKKTATWKRFVRTQWDLLSSTDYITAEVGTVCSLIQPITSSFSSGTV